MDLTETCIRRYCFGLLNVQTHETLRPQPRPTRPTRCRQACRPPCLDRHIRAREVRQAGRWLECRKHRVKATESYDDRCPRLSTTDSRSLSTAPGFLTGLVTAQRATSQVRDGVDSAGWCSLKTSGRSGGRQAHRALPADGPAPTPPNLSPKAMAGPLLRGHEPQLGPDFTRPTRAEQRCYGPRG